MRNRDGSTWTSSTLQIDSDRPYQVHDLLSDQRYQWRGGRNYVMLDPRRMPAHVFRLRRHLRSEQDFDYFIVIREAMNEAQSAALDPAMRCPDRMSMTPFGTRTPSSTSST